jgi:serine/threonine protein kinase
MGVVYKARHKRLNRIVALKTIQPGAARPTDDVVGRLRLEAKIVAALDHPNIVPLYEIGEHGGYPYLILKLIPGGDLERHVTRMSRSPRAAARLMAKVARTVRYAHLNGVLHCDLKPSNILLDLRGVPYVTDFGLAKRLENESGLSRTGLIIGTPSYMAPEQITRRRGEMTEAVDIYGMGAVLYKLLARRPPFQGNTVFELLEQVLDGEPGSLCEQNRAVDRDLEAICLKCLEKEPGRRYATAGAFASDLERWLAGSPIAARANRRTERASKWYQQNRLVLAISAALVLLVTIFVLTAVVTASIVCRYYLAGETSRSAPKSFTRQSDVESAPSFRLPLRSGEG